MPTPPIFITRDVEQTRQELIAEYEAATGRVLQPAQVETILLDIIAYRDALKAAQIQAAAVQNLVRFSTAPTLDFLGDLVGVVRLGATAATCVVRFTLVTGHGGVVIPAGTRISSVDGIAVFETVASQSVSSGIDIADVDCVCLETGTVGNGYGVGTIATILDPQSYISTAANTNIPAGGAESETDELLRERIILAPASFSTAGSEGAYKFHARSANPAIIDVAVTSPTPGTVSIYPLMNDGTTTPAQIINQVAAICSGERVRPLTDTVLVLSPTRLDYTIQCDLTLYDTADPAVIVPAVEAALQLFVDERRTKLGKDVIDTQIIRITQIEGVYTVALTGFSNVIVSPTEFPFCTSFAVQVIGTTAG